MIILLLFNSELNGPSEERWMKWKIKESLKIKAHGNNLNLL